MKTQTNPMYKAKLYPVQKKLAYFRFHFFIVLVLSLLTIVNVNAALPVLDSQGNRLPTLAPMLERTMPAVVNIATSSTITIQQNPLLNDPFFRHFFDVPDQPQTRRSQSLGSGVVVDAEKGYILTNNHVIDQADIINVTFTTGHTLKAKLIGTDPATDIAVIQVQPTDDLKLTALPLANSDQLRVGDFAIAIGNPFGLGQTVTSGIVSALGRSGLGIEGYEDFIQTDASINPGNSGGALVSLNGELIGINTAILSKSGGNVGIGFAIPINMAHAIMQQLITHGEVQRGQLGAQAQDLSPDLAKAFGISNANKITGAVITQVDSHSAAEKAGLKAGDIVIRFNGKPVRNASALRNRVGLLRIGERVELVVLREGKQKTLIAKVEGEQNINQLKATHPRLQGSTFSNIIKGSPLYGRIKGVIVSGIERGSPAWQAGIRKNDVITSVNRIPVNNLQDFKKATNTSPTLLLNISRKTGSLFLYLQ